VGPAQPSPATPPRPGFVSRLERLPRVDSTQRVVREWLDQGVPEVCLAVADEQTAGRGRLDRRWLAPPGAALLVSAGFRPPALAARHAWRLAALASLAMLEAVEALVPVPPGVLALKWPNDLVARAGGRPGKLGGALGEASLDGPRVAAAAVGIGVNVDWPASTFPPALAARMTSLRELAGTGRADRDALLEAWLERVERHYEALGRGRFAAREWAARQVTTGARVAVDLGAEVVSGRAVGVDAESGGLVVATREGGPPVTLLSGDVVRCRVGEMEGAM
jgi:BirA family transcriptional regulator, biotin operon repressor / biotin---[acetyl-CoA-carboxylase] ligase